MKSIPKVTVICITYNHAQFIRQALESVVMQVADFPFEILVSDDCSTDETPSIIREFAEKYPDLIRPVLRTQNIGGRRNFIESLKAAKGQYIALCEGDDFWMDPTKLQTQADFLDAHPDHALCFNLSRWFFDQSDKGDLIYPDASLLKTCSLNELLTWNFISTDAVMYRTQDYSAFPTEEYQPGDWYCHLYHARFGKIGFINQEMSAYRRHAGGTWWDAHQDTDALMIKQGTAMMRMYSELLILFGENPEAKKIILMHTAFLLKRFNEVDAKLGQNLLRENLLKFPEVTRAAVQWFLELRNEQESEIARLNHRAEPFKMGF